MFLLERQSSPSRLRADLAPRQLFAGAGDLVRAVLATRPPRGDLAPAARHPAAQLDLALPAPARRKVR